MPETNGTRYWIAVASREHVLRGVEGGFCQVCHGKAAPLRRMRPGDGIAYYSSVQVFGEKEPCRAFTAIGSIVGDAAYPFEMSEAFVPFRRDVAFLPARDAPILPLIDRLSFLPDKKRWGYPFRFGVLEAPESDFLLIADAMGVDWSAR